MGYQKFIGVLNDMIGEILETQGDNIRAAAELVRASIMDGGILQAFGSGHSYGVALEICGRAGALIPSKAMEEPARGDYETIEGVGRKYMEKSDVRPEDVVVIISNSSRNPLPIEVAEFVREKGAKVIVVTSLEVSKTLTSRHSSGKMLYEYADVVLDNRGVYGDAAVQLEGMPVKICGTSSITSSILVDCIMCEAIEKMVAQGYLPPVYTSLNVDGGTEANLRDVERYAQRIYHK